MPISFTFDKKQEQQWRAEQWTNTMNECHLDEINECETNSIIYYPDSCGKTTTSGTPSSIKVQDIDAVSAIFEARASNPDAKICVLNFASYKNPGGQFINGSMAQEEALCHSSFLYNVLSRFDETYYKPHRKAGATYNGLYTNTAIYLPDVLFFKQANKTKCDVLTCACPNWNAAHYRETMINNLTAVKNRIYYIKQILEEQKVNIAILGAWGCGVFKQDPAHVASYFNEVFSTSTIPSIVYAVPASNYNNNYTSFKRIIKEI